VLKRFDADGQFSVKMPLDAEVAVSAEGVRPIRKELLMDYAPEGLTFSIDIALAEPAATPPLRRSA